MATPSISNNMLGLEMVKTAQIACPAVVLTLALKVLIKAVNK